MHSGAFTNLKKII